MSVYMFLPLIAPLAASRVGNGPQKLQEGHLDEKPTSLLREQGTQAQKLQGGTSKEKTHQHLALLARW